MILTDTFTSIINTLLSHFSMRDIWRLVTVVPIPKSSNSTLLDESFHPIALISSGLKLTEVVVFKRQRSIANHSWNRFPFAYRSNRPMLESLISLIPPVS